jgi:hypothetical protein
MDGLVRETAIVAKAPEEVTTTATTTTAWRVGSVFILNVNFMPRCCGKGGNRVKNCEECAGEGHSCKRREPRTMQMAKLTAMASPWFLGEGKNLVVRK